MDYESKLKIAIHSETSAETLAELAKDKDFEVRYEVADNPNTGKDTLSRLAKDINSPGAPHWLNL